MKIDTIQKIKVYAETRPGGRPENQDTCAFEDTPLGFLITVCDGMGGGPAGKLASVTAANSIIEYICGLDSGTSKHDAIVGAIRQADHDIIKAMEDDPSTQGMGTTVTILLIDSYSAVCAHIGDSRIYQLRRGKKKYRTFDHSLVFEWVKDGDMTEEEARISDKSNVITKALGVRKRPLDDNGDTIEIDVETTELAYEPGDRFVLCTDGIWGMFPENKIIEMAGKTPNIAGAIDKIIVSVDDEGFSQGGKHDNLTLAIVETKTTSKFKEKMSYKTRRLIMVLSCILCLSLIANVYLLLRGSSNQVTPTGEMQITPVETHIIDSLNEKIKKFEDQNKKSTANDSLKMSKKDKHNTVQSKINEGKLSGDKGKSEDKESENKGKTVNSSESSKQESNSGEQKTNSSKNATPNTPENAISKSEKKTLIK